MSSERECGEREKVCTFAEPFTKSGLIMNLSSLKPRLRGICSNVRALKAAVACYAFKESWKSTQ